MNLEGDRRDTAEINIANSQEAVNRNKPCSELEISGPECSQHLKSNLSVLLYEIYVNKAFHLTRFSLKCL